jgi:hypothetical protein
MDLLTRIPALVHRNQEKIMRLLITYDSRHPDEGDGRGDEETLELIQWLLKTYPIDLTAHEFVILLATIAPQARELLMRHTREYDVIYRGSRVHYFCEGAIVLISCDQELPIYGWNTFSSGCHYIYSDRLTLDPGRQRFVACQSRYRDQIFATAEEPLEFYTGIGYQDRVIAAPCTVLEHHFEYLASVRHKSARSAAPDLE